MKRVCVVGLGYIGLPTAAVLANSGYEVCGVDIVQDVVNTINQGKIHIVEPDLEEYVQKAISNKKLRAQVKPSKADIFIIAVPTPFHKGYVPNIDYVIAATKAILPILEEGNLIILESTSPVGTTQKIEALIQEYGFDSSKIDIAYCPERVLPGKILKELISNDRVVGGITPKAALKAKEFYKSFIDGEVFTTDAKTAEMVKLTENSFRDLNIAFANELSMICDKFGINVWELISLANRHPRVNILQPGVGVGGHCIAVDPWFIVYAAKEEAKIIKTAREVNSYKTQWVIEKIKNSALEFELQHKKKPKIACMGLAFKPDIDDLRESPALYITKSLQELGLDIIAVEPNINSSKEFLLKDYNEAIKEADIIAFLVAHKEFKNFDFDSNNKIILDFCGISQ